jgi:hypothetical protein
MDFFLFVSQVEAKLCLAKQAKDPRPILFGTNHFQTVQNVQLNQKNSSEFLEHFLTIPLPLMAVAKPVVRVRLNYCDSSFLQLSCGNQSGFQYNLSFWSNFFQIM